MACSMAILKPEMGCIPEKGRVTFLTPPKACVVQMLTEQAM